MAERVRVVEVIEETADAKSFVLDLPWSYQPGQFVTVRAGDLARSYSLSSSPHTGEAPKITVKRAGAGSNWLCDEIVAGMELDVLPPGGVFTPSSLDRDLLLFAGGSGITPVMSIVKSALRHGTGKILLVYANRDRDSIIFAAELASLECERFRVVHWLDSERGWPTVEAVRMMTEPYAGYEKFVCGPDPFMDVIEDALGTVHSERFTSLADNPFREAPVSEKCARVEVAIDGQVYTFDWPVQTKLLDLLLSKGILAPYSCRQGTCAACACRIVKGEVKLLNNEILEEEDFAENYILACQAVPLTDEVSVTYH
jgi:3-ketosteroid 9alpha-monooxygenase subunit B